MEAKRKSGILQHISSLPSAGGIGDLGEEAYSFVDQLSANGFSVWQILPLGPVGPGNSPYQAFSAYAGEPLYISLDELLKWGLLDEANLLPFPNLPTSKVDFKRVGKFKLPLLGIAWKNFQLRADSSFIDEFDHFQNEHNWWLNDYALYKVCQEKFDGLPWNKWDKALAQRNQTAMDRFSLELAEEILYEKFVQFMFFRQWFRLKEYANLQGIQIFGDLPLYVSHDSSDVWGNQQLFILDEDGEPDLIGGVPPDYFSEDGQLWGNPVFDWNKLKETGYQWWISRLYFNFHMFDLIRIDHFRGLESFWAVPKGSENAKKGRWLPAFGKELLSIMQERLETLPVIAEDLGIITDEVEKLRDAFNLPGMKVLQFAFTSDETNVHLPHNFNGPNVVYTGTHDNNTLRGWLESISDNEGFNLKNYIHDIQPEHAGKLIEMAWASTAVLAIVPMQDVLGLNEAGRMNVPGTASGNWTWRYQKKKLKSKHLDYFMKLNTIYNRSNG